MAYTKKDWVTGEIIDEIDLDNLEDAMEDIHVRADAHMIDTDLHITANERLALDNANGTLNESNYLLTVADMGAASGLATLDASSIITIAQLPTALQTITDAGSGEIITDAERTSFTNHVADVTTNPHNVTATLVGLGNVLNAEQLVATDLEASLTDDTSKVASSGGVYNFVDSELTTHTAIADAHHDNSNDPTADEKAALAGSYGTPGAANVFVTTTDPVYTTDYVEDAEKGVANGVATLDSGGKVPTSQLPDTIVGSVEYQGTWDADIDDPTLPAASGVKGDYYVVSVAGTYETVDYNIGDWIISNGTSWEKVDNTDAVTSVFGRTGIVVAADNDYTWAQIDKTTSDIADITTKSHTSLTDIGTYSHTAIDDHITTASGNPHAVTKTEIGLSNVTNDAQLTAAQLETTITDDDAKVPSSGAVVDYVATNPGSYITIASVTIETLDANGDLQTTISDIDTMLPSSGAVVDYVAATSLLAANLETTITDDDTKVPSSGAVVDYVAANGGGIDINALTEKTNPVDADIIVIEDSADSYNQKKVQISNLPAGGSTTAYITRTLRFNGQLSVGTSYRTDALPYGATLDKVKLALFGSLPTGADINVQVTKNGVATTDSVFIADSPASILTSQSAESNGIYVTDGTLDSGMTSCSENDYFVVTITQVGSTYAGNDLDITLSFEV
jgi:hypothetical protein